jgi:phosphotransferase system enzyme I (PtsI)
MPQRPALVGHAVSPGLAVGPVHVIGDRPDAVPLWTIAPDEIDGEIQRLHTAVRNVSEDIAVQQKLLRAQVGEQDAAIFGMQRVILQDPRALKEIETQVREQRINAESAVQALIRRLSETMSRLEGGGTRGAAADFSEPWKRVLDALLLRDREVILSGKERVVLAAADLTPQVATYLDRSRLLAVVTESGGRFSHGAVLVRSLGIPCVIGLPNLLARLQQDMLVTVDGGEGCVQLQPSEEELADFRQRQQRFESRRATLQQQAAEPACTPDGLSIAVYANIEGVRDLDTFDLNHCEGVGLFRTEFLYMERTQFPSEEEQYRVYRRVLERMRGRPVTMRLLDIGGDKQLPYFKTPREANPALGWRGIRISLEWRDLLRVQLRAMLRASPGGDLRILIPMISSVQEIREVHAVFDELRRELQHQGYAVAPNVPVGAMIEVPSALILLEQVLSEVDFISVGTNDLVQYLLAVDRDNARVARLYDPQHPAVLAALAQIASIARNAHKAASVCGDLAGDPVMALVLLGFGFDSVSVAPHFQLEVKYAVRQLGRAAIEQLAQRTLAQRSPGDVRNILSEVRSRLYDRPAS